MLRRDQGEGVRMWFLVIRIQTINRQTQVYSQKQRTNSLFKKSKITPPKTQQTGLRKSERVNTERTMVIVSVY